MLQATPAPATTIVGLTGVRCSSLDPKNRCTSRQSPATMEGPENNPLRPALPVSSGIETPLGTLCRPANVVDWSFLLRRATGIKHLLCFSAAERTKGPRSADSGNLWARRRRRSTRWLLHHLLRSSTDRPVDAAGEITTGTDAGNRC